MNKLLLLLSAAFFILTLSYCGTARRGEPVFRPVPTHQVQITQGQAVYMNYCQKCHPGGDSGLGPAINNKPLPGFLIRFQIRNGLGAMPAFKKDIISSNEMDDLIAYMKTLRKSDVPPPVGHQ